MAAADSELVGETEQERVERWRAEELRRAGYTRLGAARIAARFDVDLHGAVELIERGCPEPLALDILL